MMLLALVAAIAAGCGGGSSSGPSNHAAAGSTLSSEDLLLAANRTMRSGGVRVAITASAAGQSFSGGGYFDLTSRRGDLTLTIPGQGAIREVFVWPVVYLQLPPAARKSLPAGKSWARLDVEKAAKSQGIDLSSLSNSGDPTQGLSQLRGADQITEVGHDVVRGTPTTHYHAIIDLRRAAAKAPPAQRAAAERTIGRLVQITGHSKVPVDVWLDGQHRIRRERFALPTGGLSVEMTMDLYDFGAQQTVTPPPASQTVDITGKVAQAAAGSTG